MKTILFQGDSITDCGRTRDNAAAMSQRTNAFSTGYPFLVSSQLALDHPAEYRV